MKKQLIIANCRISRPAGLPSLRDKATNHTAYDTLLIFNCKSGFYVEILKRLCGTVCRQRLELCVTVGYMKLCVDRDLNCD